MEADLRSRAKTVLALVEKVEARSPVTLAEYRARLTEKMQEVLGATNIDESRILQEAAVYADKIAVDEETVRLRSHLNQLDQMLTAGGPIGRKLDFLLQEFNRESNTIGSKGNDLEQARTVDGRDPPQARFARRCFAGADGKADGPGKMGIQPGRTIRLSRRQRYGRARGTGAACDHDRRKV